MFLVSILTTFFTFGALASPASAIPLRDTLASAPQVHLSNGSYYGVHNTQYNQDFFLGLPFAQPPLGDLRLRVPQSLNDTWNGVRNATEYGYACVGYGEDTYIGADNYVSEDCLTLNIVRPSGHQDKQLPVLVWIYGGGWYEGSARDPRYNLTFIVDQSVKMGRPIIGASINYRLHGWGWLYSQEVLDEGVANLGLRDQRMALQWLHENLAAFGADPNKVTIWGESAGAVSVGNLLLAYNGRDDGLFRGAIADSGPFGVGLINPTIARAQVAFKNITNGAGCGDSKDKLACLRKLSFREYNKVLKTSISSPEDYYQVTFGPLVDKDIVARPAISQLNDGSFIKVPYIMGDNSDEGTDFVPLGIENNKQFENFFRGYGFNKETLDALARLYPNNPGDLIPKSHPANFNKHIGHQFKRAATVEGDIAFKAPRRLAAKQWVQHTQNVTAPLYSYRFNTIANGIPAYLAVTHFQEVAFVFHNTHGYGYPDIEPPYFGPDPFKGKGSSYKALSKMMSRMWVNFVNDGDPNFQNQEEAGEIGTHVPEWPAYEYVKGEEDEGGQLIVFDAVNGSYIERDDYRKEAIQYLVDQYQKGDYPWGKHDKS